MGGCAVSAVIVLGRVTIGTSASSNKRERSVHVAADGKIEISDNFADSAFKQSSPLVRKDSFEAGLDNRDKANGLDKSSLVRKQAFSVQDASEDEIEFSDDLVDSTNRQASSLVRSLGVDAKGNIETGADNRDKVIASERRSEMVAVEFVSEEEDHPIQRSVCYDALENVASNEGNDLKIISYKSLKDCKDRCTNTDGCNSFVACPQEDGTCVLKDRVLDSNVSQKLVDDCTSYYKVPCPATQQPWPIVGGGRGLVQDELSCSYWQNQGDGSCASRWEWRNNDTTLLRCQAECAKYANCMGVSFNDNGGSRTECIMMGILPTNGKTNLPWKSYLKVVPVPMSTPELSRVGSKPMISLSENATIEHLQPDVSESAVSADSATQITPVLVRKTTPPDAVRNNSVSLLLVELPTSSQRDVVLMSIAMVLQEHVGHFGIAGLSGVVFICFFFIVVSCLAAAVVARDDFRDHVERVINSMNRLTSRSRRVPAGSDGESGSEEETQSPWNAKTSVPTRFVVKTGLLWKLERRFIDDLTSHRGSNFDPTDRFAYLESWDLRFFSLDVDEGAVLLSYVSELSEFTPVVFEVKLIESQIIEVPSLRASTARAKKNTKGSLIGLYDNYLQSLRRIGYEPPQSDTHDPKSLFVFVVSGRRQGECDKSRPVGRLKWNTGACDKQTSEMSAAHQESAELSRMCLGSANDRDCTLWHDEIEALLRKMAPKRKDVGRSRTSDLAERVRQQALEESDAKSLGRSSSFASSSSDDATSSFQLFTQDIRSSDLVKAKSK